MGFARTIGLDSLCDLGKGTGSMNREQRQELFDRLQAENAETLADWAERSARTAAGLEKGLKSYRLVAANSE